MHYVIIIPLIILCSIALHEIAHILAMNLLGIKVLKILMPGLIITPWSKIKKAKWSSSITLIPDFLHLKSEPEVRLAKKKYRWVLWIGPITTSVLLLFFCVESCLVTKSHHQIMLIGSIVNCFLLANTFRKNEYTIGDVWAGILVTKEKNFLPSYIIEWYAEYHQEENIFLEDCAFNILSERGKFSRLNEYELSILYDIIDIYIDKCDRKLIRQENFNFLESMVDQSAMDSLKVKINLLQRKMENAYECTGNY